MYCYSSKVVGLVFLIFVNRNSNKAGSVFLKLYKMNTLLTLRVVFVAVCCDLEIFTQHAWETVFSQTAMLSLLVVLPIFFLFNDMDR